MDLVLGALLTAAFNLLIELSLPQFILVAVENY